MIDINLTVPTSWREMNQNQLRYVMSLIAFGCGFDEIKTYCLFRWNKIDVIEHTGTDYLLKMNDITFYASAMIIQSACDAMNYIEETPAYPVCLTKIRKYKALPRDFEGVPFKKYIMCDNLYQGYIHTKDAELLEQMARILYNADTLIINETERISIFYWWSSLKAYFAVEYPNFFTVTGNMDLDIGKAVKKAMNTQIRALTKGDITKEREVLAMCTRRALTELDALALEYQELERKYPQK